MAVDLFRKRRPLFVRIHDVKTAPVKGETEWRSHSLARQEVEDSERACSFGVAAFSPARSIAISAASTPMTSKPCCASQIVLSPVPQPISNALQG